MAKKAAKNLATRNQSMLKTAHITSSCLHALYIILHFTFNRPTSLKPYFFLAFPTLVVQYYLERIGRPVYNSADGSLRTPGEDLEAAGLTEYMWDVVYWTWFCLSAVCVFGDRAWWLWVVLPAYTVYLAYKTFMGMRSGFAGMGGAEGAEEPAGESKRQKKMEKRGGQRMSYR